MQRVWILALALLLTACGAEERPAEKAAMPPETAAEAVMGDGRTFFAVTERTPAAEAGTYDLTVRVYDAADPDTPVQVIGDVIAWETDSIRWQDANFDGYPDICYTTHTTVRNAYAAWWLWDPCGGQFVRSDAMSGLAMYPDKDVGLLFRREEGTSQTYACRIYEWRDGELVCLREVKKAWAEPPYLQATVTDDPDGAAQVLYQEKYLMDDTEMDVQADAILERYTAYGDRYAAEHGDKP